MRLVPRAGFGGLAEHSPGVEQRGDRPADGLERLGEVRYFDDLAQPAERPNIPIPAGVTAASVVNQYLAAIGGQKAIASVKDLTLEMVAEIQEDKKKEYIQEVLEQSRGIFIL